MKIDKQFLTSLIEQAKHNPRLRQAHDLRTSANDKSQRMLNALIPETEVPIHRHPSSSETVVLLHGCIDEIYFDAEGHETSRTTLHMGEGMQIPLGQFHTVQVHEPSVILEVNAYEPAKAEDIILK